MALRDIVMDPDPILRKKCREVVYFDQKLHKLLDDMKETMNNANGVGLAGPQVGILRRLAVVEVDDFYVELINPKIIEASGEQLGLEGCLSVDEEHCKVLRPMKVKVQYFDRNGIEQIVEVVGLSARACCHEIDHLDGILYYDNLYVEENKEE